MSADAEQGSTRVVALWCPDWPVVAGAAEAGLLTCQLVRAADGTRAGTRHPVATDFGQVGQAFGLSS